MVFVVNVQGSDKPGTHVSRACHSYVHCMYFCFAWNTHICSEGQDEETDLPCDEILGPTMEISCVWPSIIFGAKGLPRSVSTARRKWINTSRALWYEDDSSSEKGILTGNGFTWQAALAGLIHAWKCKRFTARKGCPFRHSLHPSLLSSLGGQTQEGKKEQEDRQVQEKRNGH